MQWQVETAIGVLAPTIAAARQPIGPGVIAEHQYASASCASPGKTVDPGDGIGERVLRLRKQPQRLTQVAGFLAAHGDKRRRHPAQAQRGRADKPG